jgi:hypothetical protein
VVFRAPCWRDVEGEFHHGLLTFVVNTNCKHLNQQGSKGCILHCSDYKDERAEIDSAEGGIRSGLFVDVREYPPAPSQAALRPLLFWVVRW